MAPSSRKRKASELDASPDLNGHPPARKGNRKPKISGKSANTDVAPDHGYTVALDSISDDEDRTNMMLWEEIDWSIDFAVSPAQWRNIKSYKNFILPSSKCDPFRLGEIVYLAKHKSTPAAPEPPVSQDNKSESSDEYDKELAAYARALLKYNKEHFWLGKILQIRASAPEKVLLLVVWLYWPSELPRGYHQPWFGEAEVFPSNYLEVVDATTVSDRANVVYLDQSEDANLYESPEQIFQRELVAIRRQQEMMGRKAQADDAPPILFWRQCFDAQAWEKNPKLKYAEATSTLRTFCICRKPNNPDKTMLQCARCFQWNHDTCLANEIGIQAVKELTSGNIDECAKDSAAQDRPSTLTERVGKKLQAVGGFIASEVEFMAGSSTHGNGNGNGSGGEGVAAPSPPDSISKSRGRPRKESTAASTTWKSRLNVLIVTKDGRPQDAPPLARVTEKRGQRRTWDVKIDCLECGETLD